ncbi:carbohydrate-binding protein [Chitinibacter bivalviorum]|nr:carbohydrate-binding protein [Chitinibacter bivalviorum]
MKITLLALGFGVGLAAQTALACSPNPNPTLPQMPTGLDGKLPLTYPDLDPNYPYIPPVTSGACPTPARYGFQATMPALNDAETDRVYGTQNTSAPAWDAAKVYNTGDLVSSEGVTYKAKWWTQNEKPGQPWGAWEEQTALSGPQAWSSSKAYNGGDQATFDGRLYQAKWWTQNNQPGLAGSPWEDKGVAPIPKSRPPQFKVNVTRQNDGSLNITVPVGSYIYPVSYVYRATASCSATMTTEGERPASAIPPVIERWEVHIDGKTVATQQGPYLMPVPAVAPPPPPIIPRNADGSCSVAEGTIVGQFGSARGGDVIGWTTIAADKAAGHMLSVWLCNGDQCRPSTLLWKDRFGTQANQY